MTLDDIDALLGDLDDGILEPAAKAPDLRLVHDDQPLVPTVLREVSPGTISAQTRAIKAAFLGSKDPEEIAMGAAVLPLRDWLDFAIRLMPKEVAVKGQFQMQTLVAQIGPLRRGE